LHQSNPRSPLAANNLAMLLATYKSDRASLEEARELTWSFSASTDPSLLDTAGWVQLKLGESDQALSILDKAAQRAPDSHVIRYHLGMAELGAGERKRARTDLEFALGDGASFAGAEDARKALAKLGT
jgi:predicted Zn-dependent protease